jgi:PPOX class probable F420-dependent enzyme
MTGHIPFGKCDAWLRATRSMWLSSTRPDGRPHAVPVWFVWDGTAIFFQTGSTTQKYRNLQHEPTVVAHLGDGDDVFVAEGRTQVVRDSDALGAVDRLFRQKYVDPHSGATAGYPESPSDVPFRIDIERIMVWEYGVVATRTDFVHDDSRGWTTVPPA